jgi:hypothetical protein
MTYDFETIENRLLTVILTKQEYLHKIDSIVSKYPDGCPAPTLGYLPLVRFGEDRQPPNPR